MAPKSKLYKDGDFVKVVDEGGNVQADAVPSAWVGTDLLPDGWKKATKAQVDKADDAEESSDSES